MHEFVKVNVCLPKFIFTINIFLAVITVFCLFYPTVVWSKVAPPNEPSWFIDATEYAQGAHGTLACQECHGDMKKDGEKHPNTDKEDFLQRNAIRIFDYSTCQDCHEVTYKRYLQGGHAEARQEEEEATEQELEDIPAKDRPPACGHCHNAHVVKSGLSRVESGRRQVEVCGDCHPNYVQSYLKNTHGKIAVNLRNEEAAYCTDCHGAHTVISLEDEAENLRACKRCHPSAGKEFTNIIIHSSIERSAVQGTENEDNILSYLKIINIVRVLAIIVVILFLAFFFGHTLLSFLRELHEKLRKK